MAEANSDEEDSCRSDEDDGDESTTSKEIEDEGVDEIGESAAHEYPGGSKLRFSDNCAL